MPRDTLIQIRRDTRSNWTSTNPILASGEPGLETTTNRTKIGDGTTSWNNLSYQTLPFYGSFYSTVTVEANTLDGTTAITSPSDYSYLGINYQTAAAKGVSIGGVKANLITFQYPGTYNVQFSAQFDNSDSEEQVVNIWLEKNAVGSYVANSNRRVSVPKKIASTGTFGRALVACDFILEVNANDWVRCLWSAKNHATPYGVISTTRLVSYTSQTTPIELPATPSVIITVQQIV